MKIYPYCKHHLDFSDIFAVVKTLLGGIITRGEQTQKLEQDICAYTGAKYAVAVSSGTAGLHLATLAIGLTSTDEAITTPLTFLATANAIRYCGATVKFADIEQDTANISVEEIEKNISTKTKLLMPVHFAGQTCDMAKIKALADKHNLFVIEDAAHALGSKYKDCMVGSCKYSDMTVFSFHPAKTITTGEGGIITTNNEQLYKKLLALRSHGIYRTKNAFGWDFQMLELGFNYILTDFQASLGRSQLKKIESFKKRRREIVDFYNRNLNLPHLHEKEFSNACWHIYPVMLENRDNFYKKTFECGFRLQVHYKPVHLHPYYQQQGYKAGDFPNAERYFAKAISLPLYPTLKNSDLKKIANIIKSAI